MSGRWTVLVLALVAGFAMSDTIFLKNNRTVKGVILRASAESDWVEIQIPGVGKMRFHKRDIEEIRLDNDDGSNYVENLKPPAETPVETPENPANPATPTETPGGENPSPAETPKTGILGDLSVLSPPAPTSEQADMIPRWIGDLSDNRRQGGAGNRQAIARRELVTIGAAAAPAVARELSSENLLSRRNAILVLREMALKAENKPYMWDVVPPLIAVLGDTDGYVRSYANMALEAITGQKVGFPAEVSTASNPTGAERAGADAWRALWEKVLPEIEAARAKSNPKPER